MHISTNSPARSAVVFGASGQIGAALLQRLLAAQVPLSSLEVRPATLEDLFIALTGHALRQ